MLFTAMHNFQSYIKSIRESKSLKQKTIADAINLSEDTIQNIEEADNNNLLQTSSTVLKNQVRRYCEYLEVNERKIISILNKIDILYYKKSRYGKLKPFDYLNRIVILGLVIAIGVLGFQIVQKRISISSNDTPQSSKSSIIYTPINYEMDNDADETQEQAGDTTASSTISKKSLVANPPSTANISNMIIDEPSDK
jgi:cytoskeleton protein RodZ